MGDKFLLTYLANAPDFRSTSREWKTKYDLCQHCRCWSSSFSAPSQSALLKTKILSPVDGYSFKNPIKWTVNFNRCWKRRFLMLLSWCQLVDLEDGHTVPLGRYVNHQNIERNIMCHWDLMTLRTAVVKLMWRACESLNDFTLIN